MSQEPSTERVWTPANVVTLVRILLIPVFVAVMLYPWPGLVPDTDFWNLWQPWLAAVVFAFISCTDAIDGHLARSRGEVTDLGKFLDPLADKILVCSALLALIELGVLPSWIALIIIAREFIVSGLRMVASSQGKVIAASYLGKVKTVLQIVAIIMFTVKDTLQIRMIGGSGAEAFNILAWVVMIAAVVMTVVSFIDYFVKTKDLLGFKKRNAGKDADVPVQAEDAWEGVDSSAASVLDILRTQGLTLSAAESCTGGLVAAALTDVPGSSEVFKGCAVTYWEDAKEAVLGVSRELIETHGVVSEEVAIAMATGACTRYGTDCAVSTTGIAGPGGAEPGKPVGTVCIAAATPNGVRSYRVELGGDRQQVRADAVEEALKLLSEELSK